MKEKNKVEELNLKLNVIGRISQFFVNRFEMAALLIGLVLVIGIFSINQLPKESLPEIIFPSITVSTVYPGATPSDIENLVTEPIERALNSLNNVTDVTSTSNDGLSVVTVTFVEGLDMDRVKIELDNALNGVSLPQAAFEPTSFIFKTSEIPLISISLLGDDLFELTKTSEDIGAELEKINGVDSVNIFGGLEKEVQIITNQPLLQENGLTIQDLSNALAAVNVNIPLGDVASDSERYNLRIDETLVTIDQIKSIPIRTTEESTITVGDVAQVVYGTKEVSAFNRTFAEDNVLQNSIFIEVIRENRSDVIGTSAGVKNSLEEMKGNIIPSNMSVVVSRDTANQVQDDLDNIVGNALSGLIVVILVLFLFIGFKEALIVAITIPLTLLATLGTLSFFGITLNTFAILGLIVALGLLVDNTIIVMENMDRLKKKGADYTKAAVFGTNQVGFPITAATLTTVAAFFPLAILPGIIGSFINTIPRTIIITLLLSLILAITITPAVYSLVNNKLPQRSTPLVGWKKGVVLILKLAMVGTLSTIAFYSSDIWIGIPIIASLFFVSLTAIKDIGLSGKDMESYGFVLKYERFILKLIQSKVKMAMVILLALAIFASSIALVVTGSLKIAFFPQTEPRSISINISMPAGQSLEQSSEFVGKIENVLIDSEDVKQFNTTIGGRDISKATINVDFVENETNGFDQLGKIQTQLDLIEGGTIAVVANAAGGPPVGKPIEIKFIGDDTLESKDVSDLYAQKLESIEGVYNVENSIDEGGKIVNLNVDVLEANALNLSPIQIANQLRTFTDGLVATTIKENNELIDVKVKFESNDLEDLLKLEVSTPMGTSVPLSDLVIVEEVTGVSGITRENGNRTITLRADLLKGYNATETIDQLKASVAGSDISDKVEVSFGGESAGISDSFTDLFRSMILAVFLVFMILTIQFGSVRQPFIIISTVPMAMIGVLYGLTLTGNEFGFYAFMAMVSLVGIAVNDAIVLMDYMNYLRSEGVPFFEAVAKAGRTRFSPVLATTLTTIGGILPLSFKNAYYAQFGFALIFGLFVTTIMTLIMIPMVYAMVEGKKARLDNKEDNREDDMDDESEEESKNGPSKKGEKLVPEYQS